MRLLTRRLLRKPPIKYNSKTLCHIRRPWIEPWSNNFSADVCILYIMWSVCYALLELHAMWAADRKIISYYKVNLHNILPSWPALSFIWICVPAIVSVMLVTNEWPVTVTCVTLDLTWPLHDPESEYYTRAHIKSECRVMPHLAGNSAVAGHLVLSLVLFDKNKSWFTIWIQLFVAKSLNKGTKSIEIRDKTSNIQIYIQEKCTF